MRSVEFISNNERMTMAIGKQLAQSLHPGAIVALFGDLGSGKTTLVKGIAQGLKINKSKVNSPTFVLMNIYDGRLPLYHFDFYRLEDVKEISRIGCHEFFYGEGVCVIEWAERLGRLLPTEYLKIELQHKKENQRLLKFTTQGKRYHDLLGAMKIFAKE